MMPIPSIATEDDVAQYMHGVLRDVAGFLDYTAPGSYGPAIVETLLAYGVESIAGVPTSLVERSRFLRLARREVWRMALADATTLYDAATDGQSFDRSNVYEQARKNFEDAQRAATFDERGMRARRVLVERCDAY